MNFSDVSFYLLETGGKGGKKSQLRSGSWIIPCQILELVTTTITLTVITKTVPIPQTPRTSLSKDPELSSKTKQKSSMEVRFCKHY